MAAQNVDFPFPVGDDPDDPGVREYWQTVARRMDHLLLPPELRWEGVIRDRIREYDAARAALVSAIRARDPELDAAEARVARAKDEFPRLKWKLQQHFVAALGGPRDPGLVALFAPPGGPAS